MSSKQLVQSPLPVQPGAAPDTGEFDSKRWLQYFEQNLETRSAVTLPNRIDMEEEARQALVLSLQRFHVGETGDGLHLLRYADSYGDQSYSQCMRLFIREEQNHAQLLGQTILALNGTLLRWHWTDIAFTALRRAWGLKTELLIFMVAEVIGKCFYKYLADNLENEKLKEVFYLIVLDEIVHIEFQTEFLKEQLRSLNPAMKHIVYYGWCLIFYAACFAFVLDHRKALRSIGITTGDYINKCSSAFHQNATRALDLN